MSYVETIVRGLKATLVAQSTKMIANGLLLVFLARTLGPDEYGLLFLAIAVLGVAGLFTDLGLARSAARYVSESKETDPGRVPFILRTAFRYRLFLIAVVVVSLALGRELVAGLLGEPELAPLLLVGAAYLVARSLHSFTVVLFQGFNRVTLSAVVTIVENVGRVGAVLVFVLAGFGAVGALAGYAVASVAAAAVGLTLLYRRFYREFDDAGGDGRLRRRILEYSVPLTASQSAHIIDRQIDTLLVGWFLNPLAVSYYVLGKQVSEFVLVPAGSLGFSVSPTYGEQKAKDDLTRAARLYESTVRYVLLLYVPAAVGMILVAEPAIEHVFGPEYAGAAPVLQVFGVYLVLEALTSVTTNALDYLGRARARAIAKATTSVANLGLNLALIPVYGVVGAAAATVFTFGTYTLVNVYIMHRELPLDFRRLSRSVALTGAISASMGLAVVAAVPYASSLVSLAGVIALGVAIWGVLAVASGLVDVRETVAVLT